MVKVMSKCEVIGNWTNHPFKIGEIVTVYRLLPNNEFDVVGVSGDAATVELREIFKLQEDKTMKLMKDAVRATAMNLCQANNTVTTLELKTELRNTHPYFHWIQNTKGNLTGVSEYMNELAQEGDFVYSDNGQYRVYSTVTTVKSKVKTARINRVTSTKLVAQAKIPNHNVRSISRQKALDMMMSNKGHFFTAVFTKKDGDKRTINCQYMKDQKANPVGYVMVREAGKMKLGVNAVRQINLQTLESIRIAGQNYNIRK